MTEAERMITRKTFPFSIAITDHSREALRKRSELIFWQKIGGHWTGLYSLHLTLLSFDMDAS